MGIKSGSLEHSDHPKWPQLGLPDLGENKGSKKERPQESNQEARRHLVQQKQIHLASLPPLWAS